jgi:hypothetical protein
VLDSLGGGKRQVNEDDVIELECCHTIASRVAAALGAWACSERVKRKKRNPRSDYPSP